MSHKPARLFITKQDIKTLLECSESMATIHKRKIYDFVNKPKGTKLTIDDVCKCFNITLDQAVRVLTDFAPPGDK
ncbi:MAG: hypothetical protein V4538_01715 [Bacteroidota bacterium]